MPERGMAGGSKLEHEQQRWRVAACGGDARWLRGVREMVRSLLTPDHLCKRWLASLIPVPRIEPSHEVRVRCRCNTVIGSTHPFTGNGSSTHGAGSEHYQSLPVISQSHSRAQSLYR